jgi:hypothetical protein
MRCRGLVRNSHATWGRTRVTTPRYLGDPIEADLPFESREERRGREER